jgi:hypothetical protein
MAGFSLPPIHLKLLLVISRIAITVHEITQSGAPVFNPPFQDFRNGFKKAFLLSLTQRSNLPGRVYAGCKKSFIGINVAHSRYETLIQQQRFDGQFSIAEFPQEILEVVVGSPGLQTQPLKENRPFFLFNEEDLAKLADIAEKHCSALPEMDLQVGMPIGSMLKSALQTGYRMSLEPLGIGSIRIPKGELTGHSKMKNKLIAVQFENQEFAAAGQAQDLLSPDLIQQAIRFDLQNLGIAYLNIVNYASNNMGLQSPSNCLYLGQLGHGELLTADN